MPKKTLRVTIPVDRPKKLAQMVEDVWNHHVELGASSPFAGDTLVNMTRFEELKTEALEKRKRAELLYAEAYALMGDSKTAFGINAGQTISTKDTLYHMLNNIKRFLLAMNAGEEKSLAPWGFHVIIGSASVGAKRKKKPV